MTSVRHSLYGRDTDSILSTDMGTMARCNAEVPKHLAEMAGNATLWSIEELAKEHNMRARRGWGSHYGSRWLEDKLAGKRERAQAEIRKKLEGLTQTSCVDFVMWGIEMYYKSLDEIAAQASQKGGARHVFPPPMAEAFDCPKNMFAQEGEEINRRGRDARGKGVSALKVARGTVLAEELRKNGWRTVFFSRSAKSPEVKRASRLGFGPVGKNGEFYTVEGADSGKKEIRVDVHFDKIIVGFSTQNPPQDLVLLSQTAFAVGFFDWGYHTFIVGHGVLYEVHFQEGPKSQHLFDAKPFFSVLDHEYWRDGSGVLVMPASLWPLSG